ncbi:MAG: hypothetical protein J6X02_01705, partial [Bacilli bacterium]|nr:hypothetical protein [Bacilli bacterium]
SNISFKVANKFELYRFGHKVYKLCYVSLPIYEENKEALIEKYSLSDDFQIMAVVGFGNVQIEEEVAFYDRVKKETKKYNDIIKRLSELLIKPFTEESFNVICSLIEQSSSQLKEQLDIDYLTIKGSKRVR